LTSRGRCRARKESSPIAQSWLIRWTSRRRRLASKPILRRAGRFFEPPTDGEVAGVVDGGLGAKGLPFLVVLLDSRALVIDVERGHDAVGDHARAETSGGSSADAAVEEELDLARAPDVEILADHLLEEDPSDHRLVEHLGQREFGLQDGEVVAVARSTIRSREGVRQLAEPLAKQPIDLRLGQTITDLLKYLGVRAPPDPVVERLEGDTPLFELALGVLVAVDAELGRVGKVGTEFQKERPEVLVDAVEVVVVHHGRRFDDPRIRRSGLLPAPALGPHDSRLFLRAADVEHSFAAAESSEVVLRDLVLALALSEMNQIQVALLDELGDAIDEGLGHRRHRGRGGEALTEVPAQVPNHAPDALHPRHVDVQVHPIDRLVLERHVIA
jgi:hypothetical protein